MYIYINTYVDAWVYHITTFQFQSAISETTTVQCKGRLMFCETGIKVQTVHLYKKKDQTNSQESGISYIIQDHPSIGISGFIDFQDSHGSARHKNHTLPGYYSSLFYTILTYLKLCIHRRFAHDVKLTHVLEVPWWVVEDTPTSEARDPCCDFMTPDGSWLCIVQCHWCSLHMHMYMCKSINTFM